jgi:hypothetical protein
LEVSEEAKKSRSGGLERAKETGSDEEEYDPEDDITEALSVKTVIKSKTNNTFIKNTARGKNGDGLSDSELEDSDDTEYDSDLDSIEILPISSSEVTREIVIESTPEESIKGTHVSEDINLSQ